MEKLKLEHLAGYLPYDTGIMVYSKNQPVFQSKLNPAFYGDSTGIKLILRPLSDLTKEIEIGWEKFVPIDRINSLFPEYPLIKDSVCGINVFFISDACNLNMLSIGEVYKIYQKLYSWHFDIHNLINEGLAIDINTLENE